jgi:PAS domain S-box-containing protein
MRATLAGTREDIRHGVTSGSSSRTPSLYAVSFLFLAAVVVGFIWHDLSGAYRDTLTYWNARLSSSAEGRVKFDTLWVDERRRDAAVVSEDPDTARLLSAVRDRTTSGLLEARQHVEQELAATQRAKKYLRAVVVDRGCRVVAPSDTPQEGIEDFQRTCRWVYRSGESSLTVSVVGQGHIRLFIADPISVDEVIQPGSRAPLHILGAVVLVAEPWKELLPFVAIENDPSRTGETLLVWNQDGGAVIFSPLRKTRGEKCIFRKSLSETSFESLVAREGEVAFGEYTDYRGVKVFAVAKRILGGSSVVRKVDRDEALSEYHRRAVLEALVGALSILLFGIVMLAYYRKTARRVLREKIRQHRVLLKLKQHVEVSEERFSKAFHASPMVFTISTLKDDRYIEVNNAFERISGWQRNEVTGRTAGELGLWADPQAMECARQRLNAERRLRNVETLFRTRTGEQRIGLLSAEIIEFAGEMCALAVLDDVTERKRAEEELKQSKEELQGVMASIPDYLWSVEVDSGGSWKYRYHSSVVERITGRPPEFYLRGPDAWLSTVHPEDRPQMQRAFERIRTGQEMRQDYEYRILLPNGTVRWVLDSAKVRRRNGSMRIDGVVSDITERKQAEEALRRQAAFDELMTQILARFATCPHCEVDTSVTAALQETAEFIGVDRAYVIMLSPDRSTWSVTHEWCGPNTSPRLQLHQNIPLGTLPWSETRILADEVIRVNTWDDFPSEALAERQNYDPGDAPLSVLDVPIKATVGEVRGCVGLHSKARPVVWSDSDVARVKMVGDAIANVIERKRAEEALRQSEQRYRDFISHSNEGVWRVELEQPVPLDLPEEESLERILQYGYVAECNVAYVRSLGLSTPQELQGRRLRDLVPPGDLGKETMESFRSAVRGRFQGRTVAFRTFDRKGNPKYLFRTETPMVENGRLVRVWGITRDVTELKLAEEQLRKSEERWRAVFENSAAGIALSDPTSTRFLSANVAFQKMLGYSEEELRALSFMDVTHEGDREANRRLLAELLEGKRLSYEMHKRYRRKDGNLIWVSIHVSMVPGTQSIPQFCMAIVEDITERRRAQEELQHSLKQLRALTARLQGIREEERKSVAREIHDELGQALTAIKIDLVSLMRELPAHHLQQRKRPDSILGLVDQTIQSVRRISTELRPGILDDLGLVAAVEWAAEEFEARTGTRCRLDLPGDDIEIDQERATAMFRIFQETLTNVARHANASEVGVRLAKENGDLTLEVHDNGRGIGEEQVTGGRSLGILGMRERVALLGGELGIMGAPQKGTTIRVRIPVAHCA